MCSRVFLSVLRCLCLCVCVCVCVFGLRAPAAVVVLSLSWSAGVSPEQEALLGLSTA